MRVQLESAITSVKTLSKFSLQTPQKHQDNATHDRMLSRYILKLDGIAVHTVHVFYLPILSTLLEISASPLPSVRHLV